MRRELDSGFPTPQLCSCHDMSSLVSHAGAVEGFLFQQWFQKYVSERPLAPGIIQKTEYVSLKSSALPWPCLEEKNKSSDEYHKKPVVGLGG